MAFSGGPDSTALLVALQEMGRRPVAAVFDHALRPDSSRSASRAAAFAEGRGIQVVAGTRNLPLPPGSLQAAARHLRYRFLEEVARREQADWIAFGHTADDVVEGAALHLLRGCSLAGLRGMPERRGRIIRPFLSVWRAEIEDFLAARGIDPLRDPSNLDPRHARVAIRLHLLPSLERDRPGLKRRLHAAALVAAKLQAELEAAADSDRRNPSQAVRMERLKRLYEASGGATPGLARSHLRAMDRLAQEGRTGASLDLPRGRRFRVLPEGVEIVAAKEAEPSTPSLVHRPCEGCRQGGQRGRVATHLNQDLVDPAHLRVGHRAPGLRLRPHPTSGSRKLQDLFTDAKVPRHLRDAYPLVFAGDTLVWIPGLATHAPYQAPRSGPSLHVELVEPGGEGQTRRTGPPSRGC